MAITRRGKVTATSAIRRANRMEWRPVSGDDDVALARDVLDLQLVDTSGLQVVRAAHAYLFNGPHGWELAGIDVGLLSFGRRLGTRRRACTRRESSAVWRPAARQAVMPALSQLVGIRPSGRVRAGRGHTRSITISPGPSPPRYGPATNRRALSSGDKTPPEVGRSATSFGWAVAHRFLITSSATSSPRQQEPTIPLRGECEKSNALPDHDLPDGAVPAVRPARRHCGSRVRQLARKAR